MKRYLLWTVLILWASSLSCSNFFLTGKATKVLGNKKGTIYLRDGREIPFSQSSILIEDNVIHVKSNFVFQTVLWPNVTKMLIENPEPLKDTVIKTEEKK